MSSWLIRRPEHRLAKENEEDDGGDSEDDGDGEADSTSDSMPTPSLTMRTIPRGHVDQSYSSSLGTAVAMPASNGFVQPQTWHANQMLPQDSFYYPYLSSLDTAPAMPVSDGFIQHQTRYTDRILL